MSWCDVWLVVGICLGCHKSIVVIASGMIFGKVERTKHVVVVVNLTRLDSREAHAIEDVEYRRELIIQRMHTTLFAWQQTRLLVGGRVYVERRSHIYRST